MTYDPILNQPISADDIEREIVMLIEKIRNGEDPEGVYQSRRAQLEEELKELRNE